MATRRRADVPRERVAEPRPLALTGWLPSWDVERRAALDEVIAWTRAKLRVWGVDVERLDEIDVPGLQAMTLARALTREAAARELRGPLHATLRAMLPELPWQDVLVQTYAHFRILVPGDGLGPVPPHVDAGFGHGLDERNVWLALTDASGDAAHDDAGARRAGRSRRPLARRPRSPAAPRHPFVRDRGRARCRLSLRGRRVVRHASRCAR